MIQSSEITLVKVRTLICGFQSAGMRAVRWDGVDDRGERVASGVYCYRIKAGEFAQFKKMLLLR